MRIYLVRHGIAVDREDPKCPADPKRYLTPDGIKKTRAAMRGLKQVATKPELMITSPYLRAVETAEIAADEMGFPADKIRQSEALLPGAAPSQLLRELVKLSAEEVMCVGHAPHLDLFIAHCLGGRSAVTELKKAGAACLEMEKLSAGSGILVWLFTSKALRALTQ